MESVHLFSNSLSIKSLKHFFLSGEPVVLSDDVTSAIQRGLSLLHSLMREGGAPVYGVNTGFGALCNEVIPPGKLSELQRNLVMSHACGMGDEVAPAIARLMLLLKIKGLSRGNSGVRSETVQRLADIYNSGYSPVVYELGSLGASGDLAPLAHLSLPLLGMGELRNPAGDLVSGERFLSDFGFSPLELEAKEGLALLNGTQFMSAYASFCLMEMEALADWADCIAALSFEAYDGRPDAFHPELHALRPHPGQVLVAARMLKLLEGSSIAEASKAHVQDPYSFRCLPQVHGASRDATAHVCSVVEREINSVTDNPTLLFEAGRIISAGNFHGQPLALSLDFLALALAELGSISERRVYKLLSGTRGLPPFLAADPGLHSGFMIPQYTAASIVNMNKTLCFPASCDTIDSSNGQEDHVSMGANAATKALRVLNNVRRILAIELMTASRAMHFRKGRTSPVLESLMNEIPAAGSDGNMQDRYLHPALIAFEDFLKNHRAPL